MNNSWHEFADTASLDSALAEVLASSLRTALDQQPRASIALSGGSTPKAMFRQLARCELDWERVDVTLVDERWVSRDSPDSNERLLRENLLQGPAASARLVGLTTAAPDAFAAVPEISSRITELQLPFAAVVLGMGGDGHTASWFPQASNLGTLLDPEARALVAATEPVTAAHTRITLTLAAVLRSRTIALHITGDAKKAVLAGAAAAGLPVAAVLQQTVTPIDIWWAPTQ